MGTLSMRATSMGDLPGPDWCICSVDGGQTNAFATSYTMVKKSIIPTALRLEYQSKTPNSLIMTRPGGAVAENIALLALNPNLETLSINPIPASLDQSQVANQYSLSFKQEQKIAEAFAVLLVNTDDTTKVGAVCIEEHRDGKGLVVRTAVNSGAQDERKSAFERIAGTLMRAASTVTILAVIFAPD